MDWDYQCDSCDRTFASQRACNQHMTAVGHARFHCDDCDRTFKTWNACKQHMNVLSHWTWPYECDTCSARFAYEDEAEMHMEDEDHFTFPYHCETCNLMFRSEDNRDDHQQQEGHYKHLHCSDCDRYFQSANNLGQHMKSRVHQGATVACPFCKTMFTTASGVSHHLETASCPRARNLDRNAIHRAIRQRDTSGVITERLLQWTDSKKDPYWDPEDAWNGYGYECYICHRPFASGRALEQHVTSPAHQAALYHCPNKTGNCGGKTFVSLAALFNHLESESCRFAKFETVQKSVNGFLTGGRQRLIAF